MKQIRNIVKLLPIGLLLIFIAFSCSKEGKKPAPDANGSGVTTTGSGVSSATDSNEQKEEVVLHDTDQWKYLDSINKKNLIKDKVLKEILGDKQLGANTVGEYKAVLMVFQINCSSVKLDEENEFEIDNYETSRPCKIKVNDKIKEGVVYNALKNIYYNNCTKDGSPVTLSGSDKVSNPPEEERKSTEVDDADNAEDNVADNVGETKESSNEFVVVNGKLDELKKNNEDILSALKNNGVEPDNSGKYIKYLVIAVLVSLFILFLMLYLLIKNEFNKLRERIESKDSKNTLTTQNETPVVKKDLTLLQKNVEKGISDNKESIESLTTKIGVLIAKANASSQPVNTGGMVSPKQQDQPRKVVSESYKTAVDMQIKDHVNSNDFDALWIVSRSSKDATEGEYYPNPGKSKMLIDIKEEALIPVSEITNTYNVKAPQGIEVLERGKVVKQGNAWKITELVKLKLK